jgi:hypothetical protein
MAVVTWEQPMHPSMVGTLSPSQVGMGSQLPPPQSLVQFQRLSSSLQVVQSLGMQVSPIVQSKPSSQPL